MALGVNETDAVLTISEEFKLDRSMMAGRYPLLNRESAEQFYPECRKRGVSIVAAGVFNSGILGVGSAGNKATRI
jgi:D-threo-aldose 1-dehydrogenase